MGEGRTRLREPSRILSKTNNKAMKKDSYKYVVRLPPTMRNKLAEAAGHYHRSVNSEIVARLEQSFGVLPQGSVERQVEPPLHSHLEAIFRSSLNETEQSLIKVFRRLSSSRQKALVKLLE